MGILWSEGVAAPHSLTRRSIMARALTESIPQSTIPSQPTLNRKLRRWLATELRQLRSVVVKSAARCGAERYRKHFNSFGHACLLIFHGLSGGQSLRQSYEAFAACPGLVELASLAGSDDPEDERLSVSYSHFAASNTSRPAAFLGGVVNSLIARVRQYARLPDVNLPQDLHILDSTFLRLSVLLAPWIKDTCNSHAPGMRFQVQYLPALDLPEHILITDTRTNDCQGLDQAILDNPSRLAELKDHTLVFDLGYYSHRRFASLLSAGVHLVTRLNYQAMVRVEDELPVQKALPSMPDGRITVLSDQRVTVGSPNNRAGAVLKGLRLVTARVEPLAKAARRGAKPVVYRILTDRWDIDAADVIQLYLWRWQIELFFRWLKRYIHLSRPIGYSSNAVELTLWLAITVHLLSVLAARALGMGRRSPVLLRRMVWALSHVSSSAHEGDATPAGQLCFSRSGTSPGLPP